MIAILTLAAALWISGTLVMIIATRRAPVGHEDALGFHHGSDHPALSGQSATVRRAA